MQWPTIKLTLPDDYRAPVHCVRHPRWAIFQLHANRRVEGRWTRLVLGLPRVRLS